MARMERQPYPIHARLSTDVWAVLAAVQHQADVPERWVFDPWAAWATGHGCIRNPFTGADVPYGAPKASMLEVIDGLRIIRQRAARKPDPGRVMPTNVVTGLTLAAAFVSWLVGEDDELPEMLGVPMIGPKIGVPDLTVTTQIAVVREDGQDRRAS